jgi:hypothetical protein
MPQCSEPFSVPDDLADEWDDMVQRNQALQAANEPLDASADDVAANGDDVPTADWMAQRTQQIADALNPPPEPGDSGADSLMSGQGVDGLEGGVGDDIVRTPAPVKPLTGRTPNASSIANAVDAVAAGPNTSAPIHSSYFNGTIRRGAGQDIHLHGDVDAQYVHSKGVDVCGVLEGPDAQGGVRISGIKGSGLPFHMGLPPRLRLYNGPNGELDVDIAEPVTLGGIPIKGAGRYAVP